jgi:cyclic beta-1,2-glucan synthetase
VAAARQHRWARGDWQLLPWLLPRVPVEGGGREPNAIPLIGRWKIADNLRRSLVAPAGLASLLAAWTLPGARPGVWTLFVAAAFALPGLVSLVAGLVPRSPGLAKRSYLRGLGEDALRWLAQTALRLIFLAHEAWLMVDAVGRTLWRLLVSRRRRLEWVTAAATARRIDLDVAGMFVRMRVAPALAAAATGLVEALRPGSWPAALGVVAGWVLSPVVANAVSLPPRHLAPTLRPADAQLLRRVARRSWRYFEEYAGAEFNHLPADNFQEEPAPVVAERTSPTNVGLGLLAAVAARDFGWIGAHDLVDRLERSLQTLDRLERFRGHLFNWYGLRDLRPLEPRYISTVDSGNLAGHLIVVRQACLEGLGASPFPAFAAEGAADALSALGEALAAAPPPASAASAPVRRDLLAARDEAAALLASPPAADGDAAPWLERLAAAAAALVDAAEALSEAGELPGAALEWARATQATIASHQRDLAALLPWLRRLAVPGADASCADLLGELAPRAVSLDGLPELYDEAQQRLARLPGASAAELRGELQLAGAAAAALMRRLAALAATAERLVRQMDFSFLFDAERQLFSIGYRVEEGRLDPGYYDLLASEARLASFLAIATGQVPTAHWFRLGRPLTPVGGGSALVSWSGSMFEYLMPELVMAPPEGSLLQHTARLVVRRQIDFGRERGVPWGVSESAYNARDLDLNYQYRAFGVSGLGLKRGLAEDLVVAPYATALAAMLLPDAAARNFQRFAEAGAEGRYGFYEALDFTPARLPEGQERAVVRAFMAHHQGMTIAALDNALHQGVLRRRFHAEPAVQASELLLQERTPRGVPVTRPRADEVRGPRDVRAEVLPVLRHFSSPHDTPPRTHLLSNGRYSVMITAAGSGYSRWRGIDITRWREDPTLDPWGSFVFLRDTRSGEVWSAGYQPSGVEPERYAATYSEDRAEIHRRDGPLATTLEVLVSAEDDAEVRQVSIANLGTRSHEIELTSYAELALAPAAVDAAHPAFAKLFVRTEFVAAVGTLLATRRPRDAAERPIWVAHVAAAAAAEGAALQFETDRARFLGRGRLVREASSVRDGRPLSNSAGAVLDPILALRRRVRVGPGETARVSFVTLAASSRDEVLRAADKYREPALFERLATLAWTQAQVQLRHLGIAADEAHLFQRLATRVLYADSSLRAPEEVLRRNRRGPSGLWRHGLSGDLPIVLLRVEQAEDQEIVRQLLRAHEYWRLKGLAVDLVILNEQGPAYGLEVQNALEALRRSSRGLHDHARHAAAGEVFVLRGDLLSAEERDLLRAAARAVLLARHGSLADQVVRQLRRPPAEPPPRPAPPLPPSAEPPPPQRPELEFWNGVGGFAADGREYVVALGDGQWTPAPWINVVANPHFGFIVSESGSGPTWALNSRENQLTPWSNDPVSDPPGEALLLRDEETGEIFGPTPLPTRDGWPYLVRHGQGWSRFAHARREFECELLQFVPLADPVKISRLWVTNRSARRRRLTVAAYAEWVLGSSRARNAPFVVSERDPGSGALLAWSPWNEEFAGRVAFADLGGRQTAWTADRTEFIGRNGELRAPAGLVAGRTLSGRTGAGLDPCAALATTVELAPGERLEVRLLLGQGADLEQARSLVERYRAADLDACLDEVVRYWDDTLGALQITTPERSLNLMVNRWLLYQTQACRLWARSAFYQAGGAYGFRDQLQDVMALAVARRDLAREQLLRAAGRQFVEGDVQHWWHEPSGKGVRTRMSDDRVWLAYATLHYLEVTGDRAVLDEQAPFLAGQPLAADEAERYFQPGPAGEQASLYEHCARALDRSLAAGRNGLPLIGTGDWNDGMNRVGKREKGESVWLAWFLHTNLWEFAKLAEARGDATRADRWRRRVRSLKRALERSAWDGDWYRRAFFDDGTPLGSAANPECRIDSIAQSWGVISGAAEPERGRRAMAAVEEYLVRRGDGLVLLLTPPFDRWEVDPGYIKGYPPGVRENGGQYTHAALWAVIAFAALGDGDRAGELLSILNPIHHARTRAGVYRYKVEPYVVAADVYAELPHVGRGGWTWYTGSAGWMYRAAVEWILGFRLRGTRLHLDPCVPRSWPGFEVAFRYHSARYRLTVENPHGAGRGVRLAELDGQPVTTREIPLADDGAEHRIRVVLGTGGP